LRNAHALEKQAEDILENQYKRLDLYPELKTRVGQHLEETRSQIKRVEGCLEELGTSTSTFKDVGMQVMGNMQTMMHAAASDEVLKNSFASFAFENFEIASYKALITMAEEAHKPRIAEVCRGILREEEAMAAWLDQHLTDTVRSYIHHVAAGHEGQALA
jgi:ferritin-like metal-binding protein YciE